MRAESRKKKEQKGEHRMRTMSENQKKRCAKISIVQLSKRVNSEKTEYSRPHEGEVASKLRSHRPRLGASEGGGGESECKDLTELMARRTKRRRQRKVEESEIARGYGNRGWDEH